MGMPPSAAPVRASRERYRHGLVHSDILLSRRRVTVACGPVPIPCAIWLKAQQVCRYQPSCQGVDGVGQLLPGRPCPAWLVSPPSAKITGVENSSPSNLMVASADVDGQDSPVGGLGGQGPFDRHSQPLQQLPGYCGVGGPRVHHRLL